VLVLGPGSSEEDSLAQGLPYVSWAFVLEPLESGRSRLLARFRSTFRPDVAGYLANQVLVEPVSFIMERKMLLGIKARAERPPLTA
jgi:hypothetical protein